MAVIIRARESSDVAGVRAVRREAFARLREVYRPTTQMVDEAKHAVDLGELVALIDEQIVGNVRYRQREGRLHIVGLAVKPSFQRRGIGRAMVERLIEIGRALGLRELSLFTIEQTGNVAAFERMGFVVMERALAEGAESLKGEALYECLMVKPAFTN